MLSAFNNFFSMYVYLPELFLGIVLLFLFLFLLFDKMELKIINKKIINKKILSINLSLIFLIFLSIFYLSLLLFNNYSDNYEGDSFSQNSMINFTKKFFILISFLAFSLFYKYNSKFKGRALNFELYLSFFFIFFSSLLLLQVNNLISFYVLIELQSIVLYFLIAFDRSSSISAESGLKYFLISIFMSIIFLLGVSLVYITFGTTNLGIISLLMYNLSDFGLLLYGILLIIIFILFKLAVVPFHFWALDVYEGASWPVIGVLSVISKVPLIIFFIKLLLILGLDFNVNLSLNVLIIILNIFGLSSVFIGTFGAVYYVSLRKILVYSGIANIGYMLIAFGSSNFLAMVIAYIYFLFYSLVLILLLYFFLLSLGITFKDYSFQFSGLASRNTYLSILFLFLFFIFIGLPPLAGFWTKFLLIYSIIYTGGVFKALFVFLSNILSAVYYLRVIREIYFGKRVLSENLVKKESNDSVFDVLLLFLGVFLSLVLLLLFLNFDKVVWLILLLFF